MVSPAQFEGSLFSHRSAKRLGLWAIIEECEVVIPLTIERLVQYGIKNANIKIIHVFELAQGRSC